MTNRYRRHPDCHEVTYHDGGETYHGETEDPVTVGAEVEVLRPGGPVCDGWNGRIWFRVLVSGLPLIVAGPGSGWIVATIRADRREKDGTEEVVGRS